MMCDVRGVEDRRVLPLPPQVEEAEAALAAIRDRHADLLRVEKTLFALHELFLDLTVHFGASQREMMDNIEASVTSANDYVEVRPGGCATHVAGPLPLLGPCTERVQMCVPRPTQYLAKKTSRDFLPCRHCCFCRLPYRGNCACRVASVAARLVAWRFASFKKKLMPENISSHDQAKSRRVAVRDRSHPVRGFCGVEMVTDKGQQKRESIATPAGLTRYPLRRNSPQQLHLALLLRSAGRKAGPFSW